jgi:transcriptional regulator with XRE-family HTH domain
MSNKAPKGNNLKELRMKAGLTQPQAALMLGVCSRALWGWESGLHHPRRNNLVKMVSVYGILSNGIQPMYVDMEDKPTQKSQYPTKKVCLLKRVRHLSNEALLKLGVKVYEEAVKRGLINE